MNKNKLLIILVTVLLANLLFATEAGARECRGIKLIRCTKSPGFSCRKFAKKYKVSLIIDNSTIPDAVVGYTLKHADDYLSTTKFPPNVIDADIELDFGAITQKSIFISTAISGDGTIQLSFDLPYLFQDSNGTQTIQFMCVANTDFLCSGCCKFNGTCTSTFSLTGQLGQFTANGTVIGVPGR